MTPQHTPEKAQQSVEALDNNHIPTNITDKDWDEFNDPHSLFRKAIKYCHEHHPNFTPNERNRFHLGAHWQSTKPDPEKQQLIEALRELLRHAPSVEELGGKKSASQSSFGKAVIEAQRTLDNLKMK